MKNPLRYQMTEYDCGPTTMMNAVSYLFPREEIPPDVAKHIMLYCLDAYNGKGESGKSGTSCMAMMFLCSWLGQFGKAKGFPVEAQYLAGAEVAVGPNSPIVSALQQNGAVVVRLRYGCWHYALLTGVEGDDFLLFDPYYRKRPFQQPDIRLVDGQPCRCNRRVPRRRLADEGKAPYALGPRAQREAVVLFNRKTRTTPERTIEYFI